MEYMEAMVLPITRRGEIKMAVSLAFGLNKELPAGATAAWGARWIFPNDMLPDRQDFAGMETPAGVKLKAWLNGVGIRKAKDMAERLDKQGSLYRDENRTATLYEDLTGVIVGNPQASHGYLYVAAWLKEEDERLNLTTAPKL
jgi:hypothetical protein